MMDTTSEKERLNVMIDAIMQVAKGEYSAQVELSGKNDDLDSLALGINMMIDDIRINIEEIKKERKNVEEKARDLEKHKGQLDGKIKTLEESELATLNIMEDLQITISALEEAEKEIKDLNINLEKKVDERTSEVKRLLDQKDEFIDQLGHDLKTPLTPVITLLPIVKKNIHNKKLEEMLDVAIQNSDYMKNLVVKTLSIARLNSPNFIVEIKEINLFNEINKILEKKYFMISENKLKIKNIINTDIIARVDLVLLEELIDNLITNSIIYKKQGENVEILISSEKKDNEVIVTVKDNGIGLTSDQIDKIFNEFYKADPSRHNLESTGLGLAICS